MSLNSINKFLTHDKLWITISIVSMLLLLSPLLFNGGEFYVPIFDNLDSTVVWYKILANSGMIFADNSAIIPNMMNGLPRASYFGEFNVILWLYYFFETKTAYIINEVIIHLVAFFSMYLFLKKYVVTEKSYYQNVPIFIGALYFSLIPYWSGAGLTIASIPLATYVLLNIKNNIDTKWDWVFLIILPLYSSFIFFYIFYISFAILYLIWISIQNRQIPKRFFLALFLMGTVFLLTEYRLLYAMFIDSGFISHRTEFDVFYKHDFLTTYKSIQNFFLHGHPSHVSSLQSYYVLPIIFISLLLSLSKKYFNKKESFIILSLIMLSFIVDFWTLILNELYSLAIIIAFLFYLLIFSKKDKIIATLMLFQIFIISLSFCQVYNECKFISNSIPLLKEFNITRLAFIQPVLLALTLVYSTQVFLKKLQFTHIFIFIFLIFQIMLNIKYSFYQTKETSNYASFEQYYAPKLFKKIKQTIPEPLNTIRVISYGIEPAVTLYNGFHTIDGYSVNYPIDYKYKFRNIIAQYLDKKENKEARKIYDKWGGKPYILSTTVTLKFYKKDIKLKNINFNIQALYDLNTNYIISSYQLKDNNLIYLNKFKGKKNSWDIYVYKIIGSNATKFQ